MRGNRLILFYQNKSRNDISRICFCDFTDEDNKNTCNQFFYKL